MPMDIRSTLLALPLISCMLISGAAIADEFTEGVDVIEVDEVTEPDCDEETEGWGDVGDVEGDGAFANPGAGKWTCNSGPDSGPPKWKPDTTVVPGPPRMLTCNIHCEKDGKEVIEKVGPRAAPKAQCDLARCDTAADVIETYKNKKK